MLALDGSDADQHQLFFDCRSGNRCCGMDCPRILSTDGFPNGPFEIPEEGDPCFKVLSYLRKGLFFVHK